VHADNNVALANALILMHFRLSHLNFLWFSNRTHSLTYTYTHTHILTLDQFQLQFT